MLLLTGLLIFLSIRSASPPAVRVGEIPDSAFSVKRAYTHLLQVASFPHSTGTKENEKVRDYIAATCRQFGFTVEIQNTTSIVTRGGHINAARVYNIIAVKKGQLSSKAVMLMAHYDSHNNSPGAADDGAGVAAMLETARALQKTDALQNDVVLLFTDGEEIGLMGARAFVKESPLMKNIGLVINFEGRGNAGPSNMFEVNDNNGWAIDQYKKSVAHPFGNSLGYEVYKKLPYDTDFTIFKNSGITGWNNAYIDGFVNYHSPNDKPENMDMRSMQHQGDNMLSLVKHFGNLDITYTKAPDASYFNVAGSWFVHYPASWNLIFVLFTNLLFIIFLLVGIKNKKIMPGGFVISTLLFPLVLGILYFASKYLLKVILFLYPLYTHFDLNNSYNSGWYFLAMSAGAVTVFSIIYCLAAKKINVNSLLAGILLLAILLMNGMQYSMPSASYLLFIPLLFILSVRLLVFHKKLNEELPSPGLIFLNLISVSPAIFLLAPTVYFAFIVFALGVHIPFVVVALGICLALLLPVLYPALQNQKLLIPLTAFACFLAAISGGHFTSTYSDKYPLQSYLSYSLNIDSGKAKWHSQFGATDKWPAGFFTSGATNAPADGHQAMPVNKNAAFPFLATTVIIKKDTLDNGKRKLAIHVSSSREQVTFINIAIADSSKVNTVIINSKEARVIKNIHTSWFRNISYIGNMGNGVDIIFEMDGNKKLDIILSDRSFGLPLIVGFNTSYPKDRIPAPGSNSNTIKVSKHFVL